MKFRVLIGVLLLHLASPAQQLSTGLYHSFATCADGSVIAFGRNDNGQLGIGNTDVQNAPVALLNPTNVAEADAGKGYFSIFRTTDGTVWMSGSNAFGNFGTNSTSSSNPDPVLAPLTGIVDVAAGFGHSVLLDGSGAVWTSGLGNQGQLGNGSFNNSLVFSQVAGLPSIVQVEAGYWHTLLLAADGTVWAFGSNNLGQIGQDNTVPYSNVPVQISGLSNITEISAGSYYSLFLDDSGQVFACGSNAHGQLALGDYINQYGPEACIGLPSITHIEAGNEHSMFIDTNNDVWGVGFANFGQNGLGETTPTPGLIDELQNVVSVAAGGDGNFGTTLFLKESGAMWACGSGNTGQLGISNTPYLATPQFITGICGSNLPVANLLADEYLLCDEVSACFHLLDYSTYADEIIWDFGPDGTPNEMTDMTVDVCYATADTFQVIIEAVNDFGSDFDTVTLVLTSIPVISIPAVPELFCLPEDAGAFDLTGFLPAGGGFSGPGITGNSFDPETAGFGVHTLTYTVETAFGCMSSADFEVEVSDCQLPIVNLLSEFSQLCMLDTCITITGESLYADYVEWSIPGSTEESYLDLFYYTVCYPEPGTYTVTLTGYNDYGSTTSTIEVLVVANPEVAFDLTIDEACYNFSEVVELAGGVPEGGTYSGTGVFMDSFYSDDTGLGVFPVTYTYEENGCSTAVTDSMYVVICGSVGEADRTPASLSPTAGAGPFLLQVMDPSLVGADILVVSSTGALVYRKKLSGTQLTIQAEEIPDAGSYTVVVVKGGSKYSLPLVRL